MPVVNKDEILNRVETELIPDCKNCFGLCCAALCFSASDGFAEDKKAGVPCRNLQPDFRCRIHDRLIESGCNGCVSYECLGAGQKVSQVTFGGKSWRHAPELAGQMFQAYLIIAALHELLWYLNEALLLKGAEPFCGDLQKKFDEIEQLTLLEPADLLKVDTAGYWPGVNELLLRVSEQVRAGCAHHLASGGRGRKKIGPRADLIGADLSNMSLKAVSLRGACLIVANLRGADLTWTDLIGADLRGADLRGADLSKSFFLTQPQINAAKGDGKTLLSTLLKRPESWQ